MRVERPLAINVIGNAHIWMFLLLVLPCDSWANRVCDRYHAEGAEAVPELEGRIKDLKENIKKWKGKCEADASAAAEKGKGASVAAQKAAPTTAAFMSKDIQGVSNFCAQKMRSMNDTAEKYRKMARDWRKKFRGCPAADSDLKALRDEARKLRDDADGEKNRFAKLDKAAEKSAAANSGAARNLGRASEEEILGGKKVTTTEAYDLPRKDAPGKVGDIQKTGASYYDPKGRMKGYKSGSTRMAASNYYPQGSKLKVTNVNPNSKGYGKSTIVTVQDTGFFRKSSNPYSTNIKDFGPSRGTGIDLSVAAASDIGMVRDGLGGVLVERIE